MAITLGLWNISAFTMPVTTKENLALTKLAETRSSRLLLVVSKLCVSYKKHVELYIATQ
jgi:hypothetical protein